jgi:hypothetical protein
MSLPSGVQGLVYRVPECLSGRLNLFPRPLPRKRVWLPPTWVLGEATLGCWGNPFQTTGHCSHSGTLYSNPFMLSDHGAYRRKLS